MINGLPTKRYILLSKINPWDSTLGSKLCHVKFTQSFRLGSIYDLPSQVIRSLGMTKTPVIAVIVLEYLIYKAGLLSNSLIKYPCQLQCQNAQHFKASKKHTSMNKEQNTFPAKQLKPK